VAWPLTTARLRHQLAELYPAPGRSHTSATHVRAYFTRVRRLSLSEKFVAAPRGGRHDTVTLAWPRRNPPRAPITICGASGDFIGQAD